MAFCLLFYTIYNHLISFFQYKGGKKCLCTISHYYFKPSKYRVIYFIVNTFFFFNCNLKIKTEIILDVR